MSSSWGAAGPGSLQGDRPAVAWEPRAPSPGPRPPRPGLRGAPSPWAQGWLPRGDPSGPGRAENQEVMKERGVQGRTVSGRGTCLLCLPHGAIPALATPGAPGPTPVLT